MRTSWISAAFVFVWALVAIPTASEAADDAGYVVRFPRRRVVRLMEVPFMKPRLMSRDIQARHWSPWTVAHMRDAVAGAATCGA